MKNLGVIDHLDQGIAAEPGDIIYCNEDNKVYEYYDEGLGKPFGWREKEIDPKAMINLGLTKYEVNKMIVAQLPSLINEKQLRTSVQLIRDFIKQEHYYMLLSNELNYYTLFDVSAKYEEKAEDIVIECLQNIGVIQQINYNEDNTAIECWIKNKKGTFMLMLFNYDMGVVKCQ